MIHKFRFLFLPLLIFLLALTLRLYHLPQRFSFTADEEYQATYARTIVQDFHPVWIGVSAGDTGFYLGPYFTFLTSLFLALGAGDPLVTGYVAAMIGALTAVILFYLGKRIGGTKLGIIAALFYAFSPLMVYFDQRYWNPNPIPLLVSLLLLALINLSSQKWWLVVISFCLGAFWHVHLSLVPLTLLAVYLAWPLRVRFTRPIWFTSALVFVLLMLPLMIFDYHHAWSNLLTPLRLISTSANTLDLPVHITKLGQTLARFLYLTPGLTNDAELRNSCLSGSTTPSLLFTVLSFLPLVIFLFRRETWHNQRLKLVALAVVLLSLAFIFYPGPVAAYYALGLIPLYFLVLAILLSRVRYLALLIFVLVSLNTLRLTDESYGLLAKRHLIAQVMTIVQESPFTLSEGGDCHKYGGWRYLFLSYGRSPSTSSTDSSLGWLYPEEIGSAGQLQVLVGATGELVIPADSLAVLGSGGYTAVITYAK